MTFAHGFKLLSFGKALPAFIAIWFALIGGLLEEDLVRLLFE